MSSAKRTDVACAPLPVLLVLHFRSPSVIHTRIAYNLLALYRSVTQRSDERRQMPWNDLIRRMYNVIIAATAHVTGGLRPRMPLAASVA